MCFSAEASFGAGTILLGIGIVTLYKAENIRYKVLACIPLLFSIQQFDEGFLWLTFSNPAYLQYQQLSIHIFLFFAQVTWPVLVPLSILLIEKDPVRKKILRITLGTGILLSAYFIYCLFTYEVTAAAAGHHIRYLFSFPYLRGWFSSLAYFIPAVLSPLVSGNRKIQFIGLVLLLSYLISRIFYGEYLVSVWCYFAAIISVVILLVILDGRKATKLNVQ